MRRLSAAGLVLVACSGPSVVSTRVAAPGHPRASAATSPPKQRTTSAHEDAGAGAAGPVDCPEPILPSEQPPGAHGLHVFEGPKGLLGYKNAAGRTVIPPRFRFAYELSDNGVGAAVDESGRPVFIDAAGRELAEAYFFDNGPDYFSSGRARIVAGGKVGFIDDRGHVVVAPTWDGATSYCGDIAAVCNGCKRGTGDDVDELSGGTWGLIGRDGQVLVPLAYPSPGEAFAASKRAAP